MSETKRFLQQIHGLERVKVYNLCCEREYSSAHFDGRVEIYPFPDHNAPPFEMIRPMCLSVEKWLDEHPKTLLPFTAKREKVGLESWSVRCYFTEVSFRVLWTP